MVFYESFLVFWLIFSLFFYNQEFGYLLENYCNFTILCDKWVWLRGKKKKLNVITLIVLIFIRLLPLWCEILSIGMVVLYGKFFGNILHMLQQAITNTTAKRKVQCSDCKHNFSNPHKINSFYKWRLLVFPLQYEMKRGFFNNFNGNCYLILAVCL